MHQINYNAPWDTLTHVCVGATYSPDFYSPIKNSKIRESLQQIAIETEEDYINLTKTLESFDVKISRPSLDKNLSIVDFVNCNGVLDYKRAHSFTLIPRPPMQPRDSFLVVGNKILLTNQEAYCFNSLLPVDSLMAPSVADVHGQFDAPLATVVGDTIILDCRDHPELPSYFSKLFPDYKIKSVYIGGHNDAVYSLVKPGLIISTHHYTDYQETFPNWTVKYIPNQSWNAIPEWRKIKHDNVDKWWVPENINNAEFSNFIDKWLFDWVGYVKETVFDVNLLQVNANTVLVNNYNKELFDFLKMHQIEPVVCPFRHRFFWDGGLHCITNDLHRKGEKQQYV